MARNSYSLVCLIVRLSCGGVAWRPLCRQWVQDMLLMSLSPTLQWPAPTFARGVPSSPVDCARRLVEGKCSGDVHSGCVEGTSINGGDGQVAALAAPAGSKTWESISGRHGTQFEQHLLRPYTFQRTRLQKTGEGWSLAHCAAPHM